MDEMRRGLSRLMSQDVSRANAASAAESLRERRRQQEDADEFVARRRWRYASAVEAARELGSGRP